MNVWRDRLHRWFTPIARALPLTPNAVTLIALAINAVAAWLLSRGGVDPRMFAFGTVLLIIGGLADALDGIIARVKGLSTRFGDFLDHCADRLSDVLLACGWCIGSGIAEWLTLAVAIVVMLNGYVGTQLEATWHEREYDTMGRGEFILALVVYPVISYILATNGWREVEFAGLEIAEYLALLMLVFGALGILQRVRLAASMEKRRT